MIRCSATGTAAAPSERLAIDSRLLGLQAAFLVPRHVAEMPGLFEMDHERARRHWNIVRQGSQRIVPLPAGDCTSSGTYSQGAVVGLFKTSSTKRLVAAMDAARSEESASKSADVTEQTVVEPVDA